MLSTAQQAQYQEQGFLVLPGFKSSTEIAALRARIEAIVDAFDAEAHRSVFSTQDQARKSSTAEFFASAEGIQSFFEEEAMSPDGRLVKPKAQAINKIGHAMHDLDPLFDAFSHGPALDAVARGMGLQRPAVWQSMVIFKQPGIGGEVKWHQDASFLLTTPVRLGGFWFALEDADRDNGCLWVAPGGHRGPLRERFVRAGDATRMEVLDATPWPVAGDGGTLPVEVPAGTLVVFDGLLPHWSAPNRSPRSRLAYTLHATDAGAAYAGSNWLQRTALPLRGFDGRPVG